MDLDDEADDSDGDGDSDSSSEESAEQNELTVKINKIVEKKIKDLK